MYSKLLKRNERNLLILSILVAMLLPILLTEVLLRIFLPYNIIATIGHITAKNAKIYGWGYNPYDIINILDPDTGETYSSQANSGGWRDKDRTFDNIGNSYRILILGDSLTFGAIVPAEKIYTRILEDRLKSEGYNVEVINISYGGWGTDQEFEALKNEGLKYKPNLVIIQFDANDLTDNTYYLRGYQKDWKPFYYSLDEHDNLVRNLNPLFAKETFKYKVRKYVIPQSEILKRLYGAYLRIKLRKIESEHSSEENNITRYSIDENKIFQIRMAFNLPENDNFISYLRGNIKMNLDKDLILNNIDKYGQTKDKEGILRILENRWFKDYFSPSKYFPEYPDMKSLEWRIYFRIIEEANRLCKQQNTKLAILSSQEVGIYEFARYWYSVSDDEKSKFNGLAYTKIIDEFAQANGIYCIKNIHKWQRARNDPHPNIEGNYAMAENIFLFLKSEMNNELARYKR